MIPTEAQRLVIELAETADRPICWLGGVRSGKTVGACMSLLEIMRQRPGDYGVMSFSQANTDRNVRPVLHTLLDNAYEIFEERKASPQYISLEWGKIWFFTASDRACEKALQGVTLQGALTDEILLYPKEVVMQLVARFTYDNPFWIMTANKSNPSHWIKTEWIDENKVIEINSEVRDNPYVSRQAISWHEDLIVGPHRERMIENEWANETNLIKAPLPDMPVQHINGKKAQSTCVTLWHDSARGGAVVEMALLDGYVIVINCVEAKDIKDLPMKPCSSIVTRGQSIRLANAACASYDALNGTSWAFVSENVDEKAVHMSMCTAPVRFMSGRQGSEQAKKDLSIWSYESDRKVSSKPRPNLTSPAVLAIMQGYCALTRGVPAFRYKGAA